MTVDVGVIYVEKNVTKDEVLRFIESYKSLFGKLVPPDFYFVRDARCGPCSEGLVRVDKDGVYITRPSYLSFRVVNNGDGTATVYVGG